ncbi:MAG: hypothetical protein JSR78_08680 [Proteobacteria bacterium]|nr:hypothetical protein [Pseudomonadota bacterium]
MRTSTSLLLAVLPLSLSCVAHAEETNKGVELAFMPTTMDVTLLNDGGKFVTVDLKTIAKGEKCRLEKDAVVMKVGAGAIPGTVRVRYAAPQFNHGGCPFMTEFELSEADYNSGRAAFTAKAEDASKVIDNMTKKLGDKWHGIAAQKQNQ